MEWQVRREASSNKTVRTARLVAEQGKPEAIAGLARALGLTLAAIHAGGSAAQETGAIHAIAAAIGIGYGPMVAACLLKLQRESNIHYEVITGGEVEHLLAARVAPLRAHRPTLVLVNISFPPQIELTRFGR